MLLTQLGGKIKRLNVEGGD